MSPSAAASQNSSYNSATWERTLRMNSSASLVVPPPLGSAPTTMSPQHGHHKPVRASLSSLSGSQQHIEQPQSMSMSPAQVGQSNNHQAEEWYRGNNKISTAKTLQLQRQLSTGASAASSTAGIFLFNTFLFYAFFKILRFSNFLTFARAYSLKCFKLFFFHNLVKMGFREHLH